MSVRSAWFAVAVALAGCATEGRLARRHVMPPPARESRAGAPERSAGPVPGLEAEARAENLLPRRATAASTTNAASNPSLTSAPTRAPASTGTPPRPTAGAVTSKPASTAASDAQVARAVSAAESLVGRRTVVLDGVDYGPGCAALARAAFDRAGHPLPPDVREARELAALASERGALRATRRPSPGDLVFLADRPGGPVAHVGLVEKLEPDGTALVLHRVARGVQRMRLNLAFPERRVDPATGRHINDTLVVGARPQPAGSLVVGVSDLLRRG